MKTSGNWGEMGKCSLLASFSIPHFGTLAPGIPDDWSIFYVNQNCLASLTQRQRKNMSV